MQRQAIIIQFVSTVKPLIWQPWFCLAASIHFHPPLITRACPQIITNVQKLEICGWNGVDKNMILPCFLPRSPAFLPQCALWNTFWQYSDHTCSSCNPPSVFDCTSPVESSAVFSTIVPNLPAHSFVAPSPWRFLLAWSAFPRTVLSAPLGLLPNALQLSVEHVRQGHWYGNMLALKNQIGCGCLNHMWKHLILLAGKPWTPWVWPLMIPPHNLVVSHFDICFISS